MIVCSALASAWRDARGLAGAWDTTAGTAAVSYRTGGGGSGLGSGLTGADPFFLRSGLLPGRRGHLPLAQELRRGWDAVVPASMGNGAIANAESAMVLSSRWWVV